MKIAHIVSTFPPYNGGMGNVAFQMVSELNRRGHETVVITPLYGDDVETRHRLVSTALRLKPAISFGNAAYLPDIKKYLDDADIVHLHYPFFGTANLVRKWKMAHPERPLVVTYHMDNRATGWKGIIFRLYAKFWLSKILDAADLLTGSSFDFIAHSDARKTFESDKERWMELPFGVDTVRFVPQEKSHDLCVEHRIDPKQPTLVFVGGMDHSHYFKGIPVLLQSLFQLKQHGLIVQAVLVGDGDLRESFDMRARALGLTEQIRFVGRVEDDDLPRYYALGDICVLPSINQGEAFGMVLLEAMACGVPVIASDLPGVRTVAERGGLVVPPSNAGALAEAIKGFFSPDTDRTSWSVEARRAVEREFTWRHSIDGLEAAYKQLISE